LDKLASEELRLPLQDITDKETSLGYMLKLAAPMVITNISFTVMQFVDRFMVSRLGTESLAAILPAGIVSFMPASFALGVMISVNTFVSQSLGRGEKKECANYCWQAIYMGFAYFTVVLALMWPAGPWIFKTLGHESAVVVQEVIYLRIMLYAQFLATMIWASSQFFMGIHRPVITMYSAIISQIVNIAANYVLIFGKFGFPAMGIAGAGWGTFIGLAVGAAVRMTMFLSPWINSEFQSRKNIKPNLSKMKELIRVGFPAGLGFMVNMVFLGVILFGLVGRFGKEALAATSAVFSCMNVSFMPIVGLGTALTAAVGKAIGEGRKEVVAKQANICLKIALVYMGLVGLCFFLFRNDLMAFWSSDDKVISIGVDIFICAAIFQVFDAVLIIYADALRGAGDTLWLATIEATGSAVILGLGGYLMLTFFPQLGAMGPWIAATVKIIVIALATYLRFRSNKWMKIDLFKHRLGEVPAEIRVVAE